jgi:hypothetical protein
MNADRRGRSHAGWLRIVAIVAIVSLLGLCNLPSVARERGEEIPGTGILWQPQLSPKGPVVVVVSLPDQRADVYRNGIRVGTAPVSTGRPGYETPPGIYTILEKQREHFSNLYDDAPMPWMQRLTWDGIALHAGVVPGRPASHGCIRLPSSFAEALFEVTSRASTVVVTGASQAPSLLAPVPLAEDGALAAGAPAPSWRPETVPGGPISLLLDTSSRLLVVLRDGVEIGRLPVDLDGPAFPPGTTAYVLLDGTLPSPSTFAPGRPARPWMSIPLGDASGNPTTRAAPKGRVRIAPEFAVALYDLLTPGTVLVVSDEPLQLH